MKYQIKSSNIQSVGFPKRNAKGEYPKLQANIVLESTDGAGAFIPKRQDIELTEAEQECLDGIWARVKKAAEDFEAEKNS